MAYGGAYAQLVDNSTSGFDVETVLGLLTLDLECLG